jgi:hypothetical protein
VQSSEKEGAIENNKANIFRFQRGVVRLSNPKPYNKLSVPLIKELGTAARPQFQEVFNQLWNETITSWVSVPTLKYNRLFLYKIQFGGFE